MFDQKNREIRWLVVALATVLTMLCMAAGIRRIHVESDLSASIPAGDPVLSSGRQLLAKHPLIDWVAVDLKLRDDSSDHERLLEAAELVERTLIESGQFTKVGSVDWLKGLAALRADLISRLPSLFSTRELEAEVAPRLDDARIRARLVERLAQLSELEGVGQAHEIAGDPLGLRELVYSRLAALAPKSNARIESDHVVSKDGKHLLLTAVPAHALGDPESSRRVAGAIERAQWRLDQLCARDGKSAVRLTTAGAYRAAIDNEQVVKRDTVRAVWLVSLAVSALLLVCFSRPLYGILTLLPASAGVAIALLVYSCFSRSMSALSLGFGAALISITVDQGVVYVAYLDRVANATGKAAAKQTFSAVSLATLTTVGGFLCLEFSGYQLLEELGVFAALGSAFSFLFVHLVFPLVFRRVPASTSKPWLPIDAWLRRLSHGRVRTRVALSLVLGIGLGCFAHPTFSVDLNRLNTVSAETRADEASLRATWGDLTNFAYVLVEGQDPTKLQGQTDRLDVLLRAERDLDAIATAFTPSQLWPGRVLAESHVRDWNQFWNERRRADVKRSILKIGAELGFAPNAFDDFFQIVESAQAVSPPIPEQAFSLLGISRGRDGAGWVWLCRVERGEQYDAVRLASRASLADCFTFDANLFGLHLNELLGKAFVRMLLLLTPFVLLAVAFSFRNVRLVLLVLFPVVFAFVATLGCLGLLRRPIDVPSLLISVVVLGMGTNFSVYLVSAYQRYPMPDHPVHDSVRLASLLDGGATVLGMAVMAGSTHLALQSVGLVGLFGVGFSLLGALILLPPILRAAAPIGGAWRTGSESPAQQFRSRFRFLEPSLRIRAQAALRSDSLPNRLLRLVAPGSRVLIVGKSPSIEAAWVLANAPSAFVYAITFDPEHAQLTRSVLGDRGTYLGDDWDALSRMPEPCHLAIVKDATTPEASSGLTEGMERVCQTLANDARVAVEAPFATLGGWHPLLLAHGFVRHDESSWPDVMVYVRDAKATERSSR